MAKRMSEVLVLVFATAMMLFAGCGGSNGNGGPIGPNFTAPWNVDFEVAWNDATLVDGINLRVEGGGTCQEIPVENGKVAVKELDRGVDYRFSFVNEEGEKIELQLGNQRKTSFTLSLANGEDPATVQVPSFVLVSKPLPTTGIIRVETDPPGATVYVDDIEQNGLTPLDLTDVPPGDYEIVLKLDGFEDCIQTAVVKVAQTTEVSAELVVYLPHGFDPDLVPWEGVWKDLYDGDKCTVRIEVWNSGTWITGFAIPFRREGKQLVPPESESGISNILATQDEQNRWIFSYTYHRPDGSSIIRRYRKER